MRFLWFLGKAALVFVAFVVIDAVVDNGRAAINWGWSHVRSDVLALAGTRGDQVAQVLSQPVFYFAISGFAGAVILYMIAWRRRDFLTVRAELDRQTPRSGVRDLILGLSPNGMRYVQDNPYPMSAEEALTKLESSGLVAASAPSTELMDPALRSAANHFWTQALRAIRPHVIEAARRKKRGEEKARWSFISLFRREDAAPDLYVHIAPSEETFGLLERFSKFLKKAAAFDGLTIEVGAPFRSASECLEYDNFDDCQVKLRSILTDIRATRRSLRRVCVDATAGKKPFSIAAAIVTINQKCYCMYVDTDSFKPTVWRASTDIALLSEIDR